MYRRIWSSSFTYWRQDAGTKKRRDPFPWRENLALLTRLGEMAPGPESADLFKQLQTKKDARIKKSLSAEDNEQFDALHKRVKKSILQLQKHTAYRLGLSGFCDMAHDCVPVFDGLCKLLSAFEDAYTEAKKQANAWDFSDISQAALRILRHPQARRETSALYDAVFIDEVQDTNELQDAILSLLPAPEPLSGSAT